eukprot:scaffold38230_cov15-Tisochrysis_lutea.AAC.1
MWRGLQPRELAGDWLLRGMARAGKFVGFAPSLQKSHRAEAKVILMCGGVKSAWCVGCHFLLFERTGVAGPEVYCGSGGFNAGQDLFITSRAGHKVAWYLGLAAYLGS